MFNFPNTPTVGDKFEHYSWDGEKWILSLGGIAKVDSASIITSSSSVSVNENAVLAHSLTADETVTWSLVGGADQARFELSGSTLRWLSNGTKDYEAPNDADTNNIYLVTVRATDSGSNITDQTVSVTVVNVGDASAEVTAFLARTSGLDATHTNAYTALIDGLVTDGVWDKLDMLHVYATQDITTAVLNLVSTNYNGTAVGAPTFTADRGYVGSSGKYIGTGFIPSSALSPRFIRDSAHISVWNLTDATNSGIAIGASNAGAASSNIHPKYTDGTAYFRINGSGVSAGVAMADARGHCIANRSDNVSVQGYKNGALVSSPGDTSVTVTNVQFVVLGANNNGTAGSAYGGQIAMASIGASMNATQAAAFYNRLRTYMVAVGVPTEAEAFLARTSGLDATHVNAYTALINGLVTDGIWGKLDMLHIYATQNATTAMLNLVSTSYNGNPVNGPVFTADRGYVGIPASSTAIYTGFAPSTAISPKFVRDSAHISAWNLTNATDTGVAMGTQNGGGYSYCHIYPKYTDGSAYFRINGGNATAGVAMTDARGHLIANRSGSTAVQGYKDGASVLTNSDPSVQVNVSEFITTAMNNGGTRGSQTTDQIAMASIGSSLDATQAANFYTHLRTYMTAVGVP